MEGGVGDSVKKQKRKFMLHKKEISSKNQVEWKFKPSLC